MVIRLTDNVILPKLPMDEQSACHKASRPTLRMIAHHAETYVESNIGRVSAAPSNYPILYPDLNRVLNTSESVSAPYTSVVGPWSARGSNTLTVELPIENRQLGITGNYPINFLTEST